MRCAGCRLGSTQYPQPRPAEAVRQSPPMNLRNILVPVGAVALIGFGFTAYGWPGVAAVAGGLVMWALLHFTRLVTVMKKAANRPIGYVANDYMLAIWSVLPFLPVPGATGVGTRSHLKLLALMFRSLICQEP